MFFLTVNVTTKKHTNLHIHMSQISSDIKIKLKKKISTESINMGTIKSVTRHSELQIDKFEIVLFEIVIITELASVFDTFKTNVVAWFSKIFDEYLDDARELYPNIQEDEVTVALQEETPLQVLEKAQQQEVRELTKHLKLAQLIELMQLKESHEQQMKELITRLTQEHEKKRAELSDN